MSSLWCLCLWIPPINFRMLEPIFMKIGMYIMAPEPIWTAYFANASHQSVCMCMLLGNGSGNLYRCNEYTSKIEELLDTFVFSAVRVLSKESLCLCLCIPYRC
jgi:hypothetical protein